MGLEGEPSKVPANGTSLFAVFLALLPGENDTLRNFPLNSAPPLLSRVSREGVFRGVVLSVGRSASVGAVGCGTMMSSIDFVEPVPTSVAFFSSNFCGAPLTPCRKVCLRLFLKSFLTFSFTLSCIFNVTFFFPFESGGMSC